MKTYISAFLLALLPLLCKAQYYSMPGDTISQCTDSSGARYQWHDPMGAASANYLGYQYIFMTTNNKYPEVFLFNANGRMVPLGMYSNGDNSKNYLNYFGYYKEGDYEYHLVNQVFTFRYMGRLWYFQNVISKDGDSIHECFVQLPQEGQKAYKPCLAYHTDWKITPGAAPYFIKAGAIQVDSSLYFLCNDVDPNGSVYTTNWAIQKYSWDANLQKFVFVSQTELGVGCFGNSKALAGIISRYSSKTHRYSWIISTYSALYNAYLWKLDISGNTYRVQQVDSYTQPGNYSVQGAAIVPGTIQAQRPVSKITEPSESDRFTVFMADPTYTSGSDACQLELIEYYFINDSTVHRYNTCSVYLASDEQPKALPRYNTVMPYIPICGSYSLSGGTYSSSDTVNGMQEMVWVFYPSDKDHDIAGVGFKSDLYLSPPDSAAVRSEDLGNLQAYTNKIKSLWTLVGMLEAAPPMSLDWDTWDHLWPPELEHDPSSLTLTNTVDQDIEVGTSFEDEFTAGADIKTIQEVEGVEIEEGVNFQFTGTFKNRYSKGSSVSHEYVYKFPLTREYQDSAYFLWAFPNIERIPYCRYPWWGDKSLNNGKYMYPVSSSVQYMFHTYGINIKREPVPLQSWPFYISDPNGENDPPDSLMKDWYAPNRDQINKVLNYHHNTPIATPSVSDWAGSSSEFKITNDNTTSTEASTSYNVDADATVKIPLVFEAGVNAGNDVKYSNESTVKSTFGQNIVCEMNSKFATEGVKLKEEDISLYWFRPDDNIDYWYFHSDSVAGNKPWYLAYTISLNPSKVILVSPSASGSVKQTDLRFSWKSENISDPEYEFLISTAQTFRGPTILYRENTADRSYANPGSFKPQPGKTYYWGVRASDHAGNLTWSGPRSFSIPADTLAAGKADNVTVNFYPNPGNSGNINIMIQCPGPAAVVVTIYSSSGVSLYTRNIEYEGPAPLKTSLSGLRLGAGIYLAEIRSSYERITRKLIITNTE